MPASASGTSAARPEQDLRVERAILQRHFGIAAEAEGAHGDGLDHGAEAADGGAFRIEPRPAACRARRRRWWCRRCRRPRRRRARSCGGRRPGWRPGRTGSSRSAAARAKAADTSAPSPRTTISGAAMPRCSRKPSVAATSRSIIEISRALSSVVSARRGPPSLADSSWLAVTGRPVFCADQVAGGNLVRRVAHGEIGADRQSPRRRGAEFGQRRLQRGQVERGGIAVDVMAARQNTTGIGAERRLQAVAGEVGLGKADHDQRDAAALPLDQRVGGERRRHRHQLDRAGLDARPWRAPRRPRRKCRRPGRGGWSAPWPWPTIARRFRPQHGVGVGAAGVDAQEQRARGIGMFHAAGGPEFLRKWWQPLAHRDGQRKPLDLDWRQPQGPSPPVPCTNQGAS